MAAISTLAVNLIARTGIFEKKMRSGRRSLNRFSASAKRTRRMLVGIGSGIVAAAGIGGLGMLLKSTMSNIDKTGKLAIRLGETTENLIRLRHAAEITGASSEALDKGLQRLAKGLGDIDMGAKTAQYALDKLGLKRENLMEMSVTEQFKTIADAMGGLQTQTDKLAVSQNLFGRAGKDMLNLLMEGRAGIEKIGAEADKLGKTFSLMDYAKVAAANDAMTRLKAVLEGAAQVATIQLAPVLTTIITNLVEMATEGDGLKENMRGMLTTISGGFIGLSDEIEMAGIKMAVLRSQTLSFQSALYKIAGAATNLDELFGFSYKNLAADLDEDIAKLDAEINKMADKYANKDRSWLNKLLNSESGNNSGSDTGLTKILDQITKYNNKLEEQISGLTGRAAALAKLEKLGSGLTGKALEDFNAALAETGKLIADLDKKDAFKAMSENAATLIKSLRSPAEIFKDLRAEYH
ncbi:hypothetical protein CMI37_17275, partial [Candidatus Pacearchaeota archaeon]|nr:hypothetical protein [Candidatus Pacearchaeota archaeon]